MAWAGRWSLVGDWAEVLAWLGLAAGAEVPEAVAGRWAEALAVGRWAEVEMDSRAGLGDGAFGQASRAEAMSSQRSSRSDFSAWAARSSAPSEVSFS